MSLADFVTNKIIIGATFSGRSTGETDSVATPPFTMNSLKANPTANRCFNMIVDAAAAIEYEILDGTKLTSSSALRPQSILDLINRQANKQMDADFFKRCIIIDLLATGNAFILVDANVLYYLPAEGMTVEGSATRLVDKYVLNGKEEFPPEKIIHIKDNSSRSILVGETRFAALADILDLHKKMKDFQKNFFKNNAMPGIVLVSPNTLTEKTKQRKLAQWAQDYNPTSGARKPAFLDGGITIDNLGTNNFREMDFENSIQTIERDLARSMGVPPLLLDGGNNANITPNHRLFYLETVMPICRKIANAFSLYFGYDIQPVSVGVPALQPDLRDLANYVSTIVNGGIISPEEGRTELGFPEEVKGTIRVPQNIAGSASNPSTGGRPKEPDKGGD